MKHTILNGDVITCLRSLPDACVQCVVTSPPYWGLRDYGVEGQIGLEPTPEEYVEKMVEVFREVRRVLRDDGVLWLNLGDSYVGANNTDNGGNANFGSQGGVTTASRCKGDWQGLPKKNLVGIPWRVAFALQADGWYLRSDIIWSKPNPMPESVRDRPTKSHEYVFLLAKRERYFYDIDSIREPPTGRTDPMRFWKKGMEGLAKGIRSDAERVMQKDGSVGRNRRTVWEIATQPIPYAHFATFPEALVELCIKAGTSERGCCPKCGAPWRRVTEHVKWEHDPAASDDQRRRCAGRISGGTSSTTIGSKRQGYNETLGWDPSCTCSAGDPIPCVVLDPFGGSGTVAKVARDLGRSSILIELNPEYVGIAKKRLRIGEQLDSGVCEYVVEEVTA